MDVSIKRDGLTLRGDITKPEGLEKCPAVIIFHGLMSDRGGRRRNMFTDIAEEAVKRGMAAVKFDFSGHGESDGDFSDMTVYGELLDAAKIIEYVRGLGWVSDIYIVGHSQGAVVGGMIAGYYRECVSKLVLLASAATLKEDARNGSCFGIKYDTYFPPEKIRLTNVYGDAYDIGSMYFRTAKTLPIYETTKLFKGRTLVIHGSADNAAGVSGAKKYAEEMDNVALRIIEGEGHGLCDISFENVVMEVADFLSE